MSSRRLEGDRRRAATAARLRTAGCVFAEREADLLIQETAGDADLERRVTRRAEGEPLEHVLGWAEFGGLRIAVGPGVFVPRRRTEFLARAALARIPTGGDSPVVVDLCCGAGALGAFLAGARPDVVLHAADVDERAVRYAERNLGVGTDLVRGSALVHRGDLFDALPPAIRGAVDVLVVNLPYVPTDAIGLLPPEARLHEPRTALDGGPDGLDVFRRVVAEAPEWLRTGGCLLVELDERQVEPAAGSARRAGLAIDVLEDQDADVTVLAASR